MKFIIENLLMQLESKLDQKRLRLILGNEKVERLKKMSILLVGVGGIGCQVLKNLSKLPVKKVTIIDLDIIQLSNLNRQFYFRQEHIHQSKSSIAKQQILKLNPLFPIQSIHGNIYDPQYNTLEFYSQSDVVISALDNLKAREHLAKNCIKYGKVLIDAGTAGFHGQAYASKRYETNCHNCSPSTQEQNFAVCTIRTRPQRSTHCAIYAKNVYQQFFGDPKDDFLHPQVKAIKLAIQQSKQDVNDQNLKTFGEKLFNYLFKGQFECQQSKSQHFQDVNQLQFHQAIQNTKTLDNTQIKAEKQDSIWRLSQYAQSFVQSFVCLIKRKYSKSPKHVSLVYDKDDPDCSLFVNCITNLRIYNFRSENNLNKLKYLTYHDCRKLIGKIIPAIASTNSIAAALQIKLLLDCLGQSFKPQYLTISPLINEKVSLSWLSLPNPDCRICSPKNIYFFVLCDLNERTYAQFEQFASQNCFSKGRDVYCGDLILIKNINAQKISPNKTKKLNFKPDLLKQNSLTLQFLPKSKISDQKVQITLIDSKQQTKQKFLIINKKQIQKTNQLYQAQKAQKIKIQNPQTYQVEEEKFEEV